MNAVIYLCIALFVYLLGRFIMSKHNLIEGLETSDDDSCPTDATTMVYKNAGTIQALQDKVDQLMKQVNQLILNDDKQTTEISDLQALDTKYDNLAEKADELANENKQRLIAMVKQSKAKMDAAQKQSDKIKFSS